MNITRIFALLFRQYHLIRGSPVRVLPLFAWVAIDIVLWGFITKYLSSITTGISLVSTLLGAVLLWDLFVRIMHGVAMAFLEDVWSKNFLNLFASPLQVSEYLVGLVLTSIVTSLFGLVVMLVLATTVFGLSFFMYGAMLIPFLLILFLFGITLGIVACALVLRFGPASEWLVWPVPALISPFVGVFYPLSTLPEWMRSVALVLPPSYVFEAMRAIIFKESFSTNGLAVGLALTVFYVAGACWVFSKTYRRAIRSGLIARYSAESLT